MKKERSLAKLIIIATIFISLIFVYSAKKDITVTVDGEEKKFTTYQTTLGKALKSANIELHEKDKINKDLNSKIAKNESIAIKRAVDVKITMYDEDFTVKSAEDNVNDMLNAEKITFRPEDKILPSLSSELSEGMEVEIIKVEKKLTTESAPIQFKTITQKDDNLLKSKTKVLQEGQTGQKEVTLETIYENGAEVSKKVIKEIVTKKPRDKIVAQGTLQTLSASRGDINGSSQVLKVKATAYWAVYGVGSTYTASGKKAVRNPEGYSTIAVDPRVIPMGTKMYVEGYGYAIAADTGSAVKGKFIDVFFNTYKEACNWGVKYVNVHILK
ncbi:3D domain-containing protein [Clostridium malenominatum]|uniref:3D domain-containing protein n=1 Tax=Clostridium malenominatum TaxID=1539 RepID=A0ABN1IT90_9CLOT